MAAARPPALLLVNLWQHTAISSTSWQAGRGAGQASVVHASCHLSVDEAAGSRWRSAPCLQRVSELIGAARARSGAAAGARALGAMPPKKAEPLAGQRSIAAFFSAKPKPASEVRSCRLCPPKVGLFQRRPWAGGRHPCRCSMSLGSRSSALGTPHALRRSLRRPPAGAPPSCPRRRTPAM